MSALHRYVLIPLRRGPWTARRVQIVRAYFEARRAFEAWERWSPDERVAHVMRALTSVVRHAVRAPYYRELLHAAAIDPEQPITLSQWQRLPPLEKSTLRTRGDDLIATTSRRERLRAESTGGSTGAPVKLLLGPVQQGWIWAGHEYLYGLTGFRPGDRTAFFWGGALDPGASQPLVTRVSDLLVNQQVVNCFRLDDAVFEECHRRLSRFAPRYLVGYATALGLLADYLRRSGASPGYPTRAILTGAEKLEPQARASLERVFGVPVYETYGSRDCGALGIQSFPGGAFRVGLPHVLLEPFGEPAADGSQEILVTHLVPGDGTIMLRYRVGDRARFEAGAPFAEKLLEITGRVLDRVTMPSGKIVHATQFPHLFKDYDIVEYQVIQQKDGAIDISIVPGAALVESVREALQKRIAAMVPEVPVRVNVAQRIERGTAGKLRPVVSHYVATVSRNEPAA